MSGDGRDCDERECLGIVEKIGRRFDIISPALLIDLATLAQVFHFDDLVFTFFVVIMAIVILVCPVHFAPPVRQLKDRTVFCFTPMLIPNNHL